MHQDENSLDFSKRFYQAIKEFQSGSVYKVQKHTKSDNPTNEEKIFLIHIIKQQIIYNDEPHEIAYIKDVTFGVLYEQSKAQDYLQSMIIKTCEQRISLPLGTMVKCCTKLQNSNELRLIERHNPESTLRRELQIMKNHSK